MHAGRQAGRQRFCMVKARVRLAETSTCLCACQTRRQEGFVVVLARCAARREAEVLPRLRLCLCSPREQGNQVVGILSDEADPAVSVMKVEHAPTESYADVGGLEQQIQASDPPGPGVSRLATVSRLGCKQVRGMCWDEPGCAASAWRQLERTCSCLTGAFNGTL